MVIVCFLLSDNEVIQEQFKLEPPSGNLTQDSMRAVCKIRMPDANWEPQTTARVSIGVFARKAEKALVK